MTRNIPNWDANEPDQLIWVDEDCVVLNTGTGKWHDHVCDDTADPDPFALEIDLTRENVVRWLHIQSHHRPYGQHP